MGGGCYVTKGHTYEREYSYSSSYASSWDYDPPKPKTQEEKDAELYSRTKALPKRMPTEKDGFSKWLLDEGSKIKNGGSMKTVKDSNDNIQRFECNVGMLGDLQEIIETMMRLQNHFMNEYNKQKLAAWEGWPQDEPVYIVKMKGTYHVPSIMGDYQGKHISRMDINSSEEKEFSQEVVYSSKSIGNMVSQTNTYGKHFKMEGKYGLSTPEKWLNLVNKGDKASAVAGSRLTAECSRFELFYDNYDKVNEFSDATNILTIQNGYVIIANTQDLIQNIDKDSPVTRKDILKSMRTGKGNNNYTKSILYPIQEWKNILPKDENDEIISTLKDKDIDTEQKHENVMKFVLKNAKNQLPNTIETTDDFFRNIIIDSKSQKELDAFLNLKSIQTKNFKKGKTDENTYSYWKGYRQGRRSQNDKIKKLEDELEIYLNSKEPAKLGAAAFTKDGEIHLAPGKEKSLDHELAHVYQQKTKKINPTDEIGGQKINTNSALEREADEIAKNIETYIPKITSKNKSKTKDVIQFGANQSTGKRGKQIFHSLEESKPREAGIAAEAERNRISEIIRILQTEKIFLNAPLMGSKGEPFDLEVVLTWLEADQFETVKTCILKLKNYCDPSGLKSVLEGANVNSKKDRVLLQEPQEDDGEYMTALKTRLTEAFVRRVYLMTTLVEHVYAECGGQYWIRSTGSDPHHGGQHALFLIPKNPEPVDPAYVATLSAEEQEELRKYPLGTRVYKPHELDADAVSVGQRSGTFGGGMFEHANDRIQGAFVARSGELGLNLDNPKALATMMIDLARQREQFMPKKKSMSPQEAQLYFFRAGILKVITDAMAVVDLHQDNVMPVGNSPLIIDAEVAFFQEQDSGLMRRALTTDHYDENDPTSPRMNASFDITGVGKSGEVFRNGAPPFREMFNQGYAFMLTQMRFDEDFFASLYEAQLKNVSKVRILPVATPEFAEFLHGGIMTPKTDATTYVEASVRRKGYNRQHDASWVADQIEGRLKNPENRFIFDDVVLNKNVLTQAIKATFDNGTIIAVYIDMNDGQIFLDKTPVGRILRGGNLLTKADIIGIMRDRFLNTVRTLASAPN